MALMSWPIIVLADDLSGAAEIAGIAFDHGLSAEVQRQFDPATAAQVVAIDTDSRDLPAAGAAQHLRRITEQVLAARPTLIFKKVDSLLRGNVRAEIEAVVDITQQRRAILLPANPSRGRVIAGGLYLIDGVRLDRTPLAADPDHPRRSADVRQLLGEAGERQLHVVGQHESLADDGIIVPDVSTPLDVQQRASELNTDTLAAGAADFFAALVEARCQRPRAAAPSVQIAPPSLLVCGSRASWPARRADCEAAGIPLIALAEGGGEASGRFGAMAIGLGERQLNDPDSALRSFLPRLIEFFLNNSAVKTLLIEGGATAAAIAENFGWTRFAVTARAPAGVGVLQPIGAQAPLVVVKPGSYPWPQEIWDQFCACNAYQPEA
jgi:uncharacterized protein YgbK (DUF1537 family)